MNTSSMSAVWGGTNGDPVTRLKERGDKLQAQLVYETDAARDDNKFLTRVTCAPLRIDKIPGAVSNTAKEAKKSAAAEALRYLDGASQHTIQDSAFSFGAGGNAKKTIYFCSVKGSGVTATSRVWYDAKKEAKAAAALWAVDPNCTMLVRFFIPFDASSPVPRDVLEGKDWVSLLNEKLQKELKSSFTGVKYEFEEKTVGGPDSGAKGTEFGSTNTSIVDSFISSELPPERVQELKKRSVLLNESGIFAAAGTLCKKKAAKQASTATAPSEGNFMKLTEDILRKHGDMPGPQENPLRPFTAARGADAEKMRSGIVDDSDIARSNFNGESSNGAIDNKDDDADFQSLPDLSAPASGLGVRSELPANAEEPFVSDLLENLDKLHAEPDLSSIHEDEPAVDTRRKNHDDRLLGASDLRVESADSSEDGTKKIKLEVSVRIEQGTCKQEGGG
eukprot:g13950.t1